MNKKIKPTMFILAITLFTCVTIFASAKNYLIINGKSIDADIIMKNGVTYVPLRVVSENLNSTVNFVDGVIYVDSKEEVKNLIDESNNDVVVQNESHANLIEEIKTLFNTSKVELTDKGIKVDGVVRPVDYWVEKVERQKIANENLKKAEEAWEKAQDEVNGN